MVPPIKALLRWYLHLPINSFVFLLHQRMALSCNEMVYAVVSLCLTYAFLRSVRSLVFHGSYSSLHFFLLDRLYITMPPCVRIRLRPSSSLSCFVDRILPFISFSWPTTHHNASLCPNTTSTFTHSSLFYVLFLGLGLPITRTRGSTKAPRQLEQTFTPSSLPFFVCVTTMLWGCWNLGSSCKGSTFTHSSVCSARLERGLDSFDAVIHVDSDSRFDSFDVSFSWIRIFG